MGCACVVVEEESALKIVTREMCCWGDLKFRPVTSYSRTFGKSGKTSLVGVFLSLLLRFTGKGVV